MPAGTRKAAKLGRLLDAGSEMDRPNVAVVSLGFLALLGLLGARTGGTKLLRPMIRVTVGRTRDGIDGRDRRYGWRPGLKGWSGRFGSELDSTEQSRIGPLSAISGQAEQEPFFYMARLPTFGLVIVAIVQKNHPRKPSR